MTDRAGPAAPDRDIESEPDVPWVLVLGGCTRLGNRRARRNVKGALELGCRVVWFDGFEEEIGGHGVPVGGVESGGELRVVGLRAAEELATSRTLRARIARWLSTGSPGPRRHTLARWSRRSVQIGRSRRFCRLQLPVVDQAVTSALPAAIVYCDDVALTTAWRLSRRWPHVWVGSELKFEDLAR